MKMALILISVGLFFSSEMLAQAPPDRTWFYNEQGQKTKVKEKWFEDTEGRRHGKYLLYSDDYGYYISVSGSYLHGLRSGEWVSYVQGKQIYSIGLFSDDLQIGRWKEAYDLKDKVYQEGGYYKGKRNGKWINCKSAATAIDEDDLGISYTRKGYNTIYSNGIVKAIYDETGKNILAQQVAENEKEQKEKTEYQNYVKRNEEQETDFNSAMSKYQDGDVYYGDTLYLREFLNKYPNGFSEYTDQAKTSIKNRADNDAFYFSKEFNDYVKYQKQFPNGIHKKEVEKIIKEMVIESIDDFTKAINILLEKGNPQRAIELSEIVLRYKLELHNSEYLPITIYYSLSLWAMNYDSKAIEVIKPYKTTIINFSNGDRKFMDKYFEIYNQYKKQLGIDADKDTYKLIKTL